MPQTLPFPEPLTPSPSRWAGWGLGSFAAVTLGALLAPLALLWPRGVHEGRRAWRRRRLVSAVAAAFVPLLAVDPQVVWAVHEEALAYQALAAAGLGGEPAYPGTRIDYTYDANGNLLSATAVRGDLVTIQTYIFDAENRLVGCASGPADAPLALTAYTYDFDGIRSSQSVAGQFTRYTTDKNRDYAQVLEERDADGVVQVRYAYGHDLISQTRDPQGSATTRFYHYDGQLSTRQLTDGTLASPTYGQVTDSYTYDAFGNDLSPENPQPTENAYRYTGEQLDANTGFYYLRARYYDQATGRFASRDEFAGSPFEPLSLHRYLYAKADPANRADPSGAMDFNYASLMAGVQNMAMLVSRVLSVVNKLERVANFVSFVDELLSLFQNGGILQTIWDQARDMAQKWTQRAEPHWQTTKLLEPDLWLAAASVVAANIGTILAGIQRRQITEGLKAINGPKKSQFRWIIYTPTPAETAIPSPSVSLRFPGLKILGRPVILKFGGAGRGRLFGFGFGMYRKWHTQFFRMDYHRPHEGAYRVSSDTHEFHFHWPTYYEEGWRR